MSAAIPFTPAVLAGAIADRADADQDECEKRAVERVEHSVSDAIRDTVRGYDTVIERSKSIHTSDGTATAALMPVWLMTTVKENKTYTFAVNGQTGTLTCDVPTDKKKAVLWGGGIFAVLFALVAAVLALIDAMGSGTLLMGVMKGKLHQAARQSAAANYLVDGSFALDVNFDQFLYAETKKRKIETNDAQKK